MNDLYAELIALAQSKISQGLQSEIDYALSVAESLAKEKGLDRELEGSYRELEGSSRGKVVAHVKWLRRRSYRSPKVAFARSRQC